jgi:pimeloyl-ACP methyl ester carboxylesterase
MSVITPELFYSRIGNGNKNLLLFHGFGQDHSVFVSLANALSEQYTCYLFDIYFHGKSQWHADERPLEKDDWKNIIGGVLQMNNIHEFSLFGYSMGAKFAFATLESFPQQVRQLILVAPDAIKTSTWYSLATYPTMLRTFFKSMIHHHSRFLGIARMLSKLRLMDRGLIKFAELQMNTEEKRKRVYYSWVVFRHLTFDLISIAKLINDHFIALTVVVGKYDKVIRPENMNKLLRHIPRHRFVVLEVGHNNLIGDPSLIDLIKA